MFPLLELDVQFNAIEPGDGLRQPLPRDVSQNWIMGFTRIRNEDIPVPDFYRCLTPDKVAVNLLGVTLFKPPELLGKHTVEGIGDHGQQ
ncbi:MAG: hypothetical protein AB1487_01985, partial [Thermodesulfobacteriota bacterium]